MFDRSSSRIWLMLWLMGVLVPLSVSASLLAIETAWADDDDDGGDADDDDDDDDDDGGSASSSSSGGSDDGGNRIRPPATPRSLPAPRPAAAPLPPVVLQDQADDQIVVRSASETLVTQLELAGFTLLDAAGGHWLLEIPPGLAVEEALVAARSVIPGIEAAPNSFYRNMAVPDPCSGPMCGHWSAVGWPVAVDDPLCRFEPHIGVVDTGVNVEHAVFEGADLSLANLGLHDADPSGLRHGTAVAAMFVGSASGRVPGLAPAARLLVVDPFGQVGADERADVFSLVTALDLLRQSAVDVASLSLAGPDNPLLEQAIDRLQSDGIPVVAAAGNAGSRSAPLYPAGYDDVLAVTAVDSRGRVYRRAVQGGHIDFAAPGVEIPTAASISGVRPQSGTSFAVPFVTTAVAAALTAGASAQDAAAALADASIDLGEPGRDSIFGWGLVQIPSPC